MAYTINLDDDFIGAEELRSIKTREAILEKLRAHFGEYSDRDGWAAARRAEMRELPKQNSSRPR
jgi:hypothetical protein